MVAGVRPNICARVLMVTGFFEISTKLANPLLAKDHNKKSLIKSNRGNHITAVLILLPLITWLASLAINTAINTTSLLMSY